MKTGAVVRVLGAVFTAACAAAIWILACNYRTLTRADATFNAGIVYGLCVLVAVGLIPVAVLGGKSGWSRSISFAAMALVVVVEMGLYLQGRREDLRLMIPAAPHGGYGIALESQVQTVILGGSGLVSAAVLSLLLVPRREPPGNS